MIACTRGCTRARRHLADCSDQDCRGCEPRRAQHGRLCDPCHRRLRLMLTQAKVTERWLTGSLPAGMTAGRIRQDYERRHADAAAPSPLHLAVLDARLLLGDQLAWWVDDLIERHDLVGPDRHTITEDSRYLLTWLDRCEEFYWIGDWFEELATTLAQAHALAPWRPEVGKLRGIPCPECHQPTLAIFGGEEDVTCLSCKSMFSRWRYGLWVRVLLDENRARA